MRSIHIFFARIPISPVISQGALPQASAAINMFTHFGGAGGFSFSE